MGRNQNFAWRLRHECFGHRRRRVYRLAHLPGAAGERLRRGGYRQSVQFQSQKPGAGAAAHRQDPEVL